MKTIQIGPESPTVDELLRLAENENLVLRTADGREFILAEADDFDVEVKLIRENKELMDFLEARSQEPGRYTTDEVRKALGL